MRCRAGSRSIFATCSIAGSCSTRSTADFVVVDGNAYTDNLKLTGPVAEIGVIGRTGLRDHDYRQQAVVTAEPGKVLPTVGALLGGPAVAAALLIFTRIFKEPLKGIGRASYCVSGTGQEPMVERLSQEQLEEGADLRGAAAERRARQTRRSARTRDKLAPMKAAAIQMTSTRDVQAEPSPKPGGWSRRAAQQGAKLVVLPENFSFMVSTDAERVGGGRALRRRARAGVPRRDGREPRALDRRRHHSDSRRRRRRRTRESALAAVRTGRSERRALRQDSSVRCRHSGRETERYLESAASLAGHARRERRDAARAHRHDGVLRHPFSRAVSSLERARHRLLVVPAAFTVPTGEVHWKPLLQARAIESLVYVVASAQPASTRAGARRTVTR